MEAWIRLGTYSVRADGNVAGSYIKAHASALRSRVGGGGVTFRSCCHLPHPNSAARPANVVNLHEVFIVGGRISEETHRRKRDFQEILMVSESPALWSPNMVPNPENGGVFEKQKNRAKPLIRRGLRYWSG